MKGLKLSKTSWLILSAGVFVVVLAGLGITRFGQISDNTKLSEELSVSAARLENVNLTPLQVQLAELSEQLQDSDSQLAEVKNRFIQSIISVDVVDQFYEIAYYYGVKVKSIGTTKMQGDRYQGVNCIVISINASVAGTLSEIIEFVIGLNNNYSTGFVRSVQINITDATADEGTIANVMMVAYSYEGS
jgi:hypothetical protein